MISLFALTSLLCGISSLVQAVFALYVGRSLAQRLFAYFSFAVAIWGLGNFVAGIATTSQAAIYGWRIAYFGGFFISTLFYHLVLEFFQVKRKFILTIAYFHSIALASLILIIPSILINQTRNIFGVIYNISTPVMSLAIAAYLLIVFLSYVELFKILLVRAHKLRSQAKYIAFSFVFGFFGGGIILLPPIGLDIVYPFGNLGPAFSTVVLAYTIFRHQLLNIRVVIKRAFSYSLLAGAVSLIYLVSVAVMNRYISTHGQTTSLEFIMQFLSDQQILRHYFIASMTTGIATISMGLFVLVSGWRKLTNVVFALYTFSIALWAICGGFAMTSNSPETALLLYRINHVGVIAIPVLFLHFVISLLDERHRSQRRWVIYGSYLIAVTFLALNLSGILIPRVVPKAYFNFLYKLHPVYVAMTLIWVVCAIYGVIELAGLYLRSDKAKKNQLSYFFVATLIGYFGGAANFLPVYDVHVPLLVPFGMYAIPVYSIVTAYAIIAHQLMDIRVVIKKTFIYFVLILIASCLYVLLIFGIHELFLGDSSKPPGLWASIFSLIVIAFLFKPIEMRAVKVLDRHFFKGSISEIAEQRERLQQELERRERLKSVGILASGMAHEIKNPLTAINTFVEYLPQKYHDPQFRKDFERILKSEVARIKGIVEELMDFSKPKPLSKGPVDVSALIRDIVSLLSKDMMTASVSVRLELEAETDTIMADADRLKQALLNIILNAVEAMKERGGELVILSVHEGDSLKISVLDHGCGIAKDKVARIFDPFFTQKDSGTGLGLAITHSIIEQHQGRIEVSSEPAKGTRFDVYLPVR